MKFSLLPLGQRFVFQGDLYSKIGPLTARRERDGQQRLIPRSAALAPPELPAAPVGAIEGPALGQCSVALDAYEQELRAALKGQTPGLAEALDSATKRGREAFVAAMSQSPESRRS